MKWGSIAELMAHRNTALMELKRAQRTLAELRKRDCPLAGTYVTRDELEEIFIEEQERLNSVLQTIDEQLLAARLTLASYLVQRHRFLELWRTRG